MARISKLTLTWEIEVSQREMNLIGLALVGRIKPDQVEDCQELNKKLLGQIRAQHEMRLKLANDALKSLDENYMEGAST